MGEESAYRERDCCQTLGDRIGSELRGGRRKRRESCRPGWVGPPPPVQVSLAGQDRIDGELSWL